MEDEDILEAGIIIVSQPPGKKLQNMMQLSGGEKALTAVSGVSFTSVAVSLTPSLPESAPVSFEPASPEPAPFELLLSAILAITVSAFCISTQSCST